jgi:thymidine kinase
MFKNNLELIIGPMFSGKSTELIRRIRLLQNIDKKVLVIKPYIDFRYNINKITSHNFETCDCLVLNTLNEFPCNEIENYDSIIIDEGQFFTDLFDTITFWIDNYNIDIVVAGLDGDYKRQPIGDILKLIPYSNKCQKYNSLCYCCKNIQCEAPFTFRINKNNNEQILIGSSESYIPLCRKHYIELYNKNQFNNNQLDLK